MANILQDLKEQYKTELCPVVSVMKNIMTFFSYDIKDVEYFGLGNNYVIAYPFIISQKDQVRGMFHYARDLSYASGTWYIEYISGHKNSFIKKLNDKWDEWVNAHQPMPIFVIIPDPNHRIVLPYILIGSDSNHSEYEFLDCKGDVVIFTSDDICSLHAEQYGFATFHVPNNFMVKSKYYRNIDRALKAALIKTIYNLKNGKIQEILNDLINTCRKGDYPVIYNFTESLLKVKNIIGEGYSNSRIEYGRFLQMYAEKTNNKALYELGENYTDLGFMWRKLFATDLSNSTAIFSMVENICKKELTCIKIMISISI